MNRKYDILSTALLSLLYGVTFFYTTVLIYQVAHVARVDVHTVDRYTVRGVSLQHIIAVLSGKLFGRYDFVPGFRTGACGTFVTFDEPYRRYRLLCRP